MNVPVRRTSTTAILSLVFGILSWFILPVVGAIVAVVTGHIARGEIRRAPDLYEGDGLALVGLILGWANLLLILLAVLLFVLFFGGVAALAAFAG